MTIVLKADNCLFVRALRTDLAFAHSSSYFGKEEGVPVLSGRCCVHSSSSFDLEEQSSKQEDFKYLGGVEWNYGSLDKKINARISKASQTLGCLRVRVLVQHNIGPSTKLKVGHGSVITKLSHRYET